MTPLLWTLIAIQIVMGVFDTFYHHEFTERLAWRPSQRFELKLHGIRNMLYALLFLLLGWLEVYGVLALLIIAVLVAEIVITLMDFVEEDLSRKLPPSERINHTLLAINYGAILVLLLPVLIDWAMQPFGVTVVYQGLLSMPLVFEQPNLDVPKETHLYFDPGDGRLITFFVRTTRTNDTAPNPEGIGNLHHLAFTVSRATYTQITARLAARGIENTGPIDRGFMDSIYLRDPNGLKVELACYKFETPEGLRDVDVLRKARALRVSRGDHHIAEEHLADAIEELLRR